jgi:hypothetical protein
MDDTKNEKQEWPDDDKAVFIPAEDISAFQRILDGLEEAQKGFHEVQEGMRPIEN